MIKFRKTLLFSVMTILFAAVFAVFVLGWRIGYAQIGFYNKGNYLLLLVYGILLFVFTYIYGGFKLGVSRKGELIYSNCIGALMTNILMYFQLSLMAQELLSFVPTIVATFVQGLVIAIGCYANNKIYFIVHPVRDVVAICSSKEMDLELVRKMSCIQERYKIEAVVSDEIPLEKIKKTIDDYSSVLLCDIDYETKKQLINYCYKTSTRLYILPDVEDIVVSNAHRTQIFDTPVFLCKNRGLTPEQEMVKRSIDILASGLGLILASPFMLVVAVAIKLEDGGPILFKQQRVTKGNKPFYVLKFRSMIVDAEKDGVARLATKGDSRITKVGKIIRMTRLDELPQLINILQGDMSLVGPRPERPEIMADYMKDWPEVEYRTKVKAGLTGLAQVKGKYNTTPQDKLLFDLLYIERYSLWLDVKLILMTLKIMFMKESTEGVESGQVTANLSGVKKFSNVDTDMSQAM